MSPSSERTSHYQEDTAFPSSSAKSSKFQPYIPYPVSYKELYFDIDDLTPLGTTKIGYFNKLVNQELRRTFKDIVLIPQCYLFAVFLLSLFLIAAYMGLDFLTYGSTSYGIEPIKKLVCYYVLFESVWLILTLGMFTGCVIVKIYERRKYQKI